MRTISHIVPRHPLDASRNESKSLSVLLRLHGLHQLWPLPAVRRDLNALTGATQSVWGWEVTGRAFPLFAAHACCYTLLLLILNDSWCNKDGRTRC